jgi:anthraniloyl-CoA monooxygenase
MKINCVGGGPGGLYLGILLQRANPKHEVTVWDRNRPDDTFGFGVVFSDRTQAHLENADPESHARITEAFAHWDAIDVHFRGQLIRSHGHGFAGLSRRRLLEILTGRAKELGVAVHHEREATDFDRLKDADLLVGADGLQSQVRAKYAAAFGPTLDLRPNRYIWLGSTRKLDAFTFSFREVAVSGAKAPALFMLHAYQFAPNESTFIVECDEASWRDAGLEGADEAASIRYLEGVFAAELGGAKLVGNRSRWIQFTTVRNRTWHHDNVVLIGDAAHTAHFSIGSGTKLAMEDAIALSASLATDADVPKALAHYEEARRPNAESVQRAAQSSLEWFENAKRAMGLEPTQFNFSLLTRSMRITHDNLKARDPKMVADADAWFAGAGGADSGGAVVPPMFVPFALRGMELPNRVVVSPMCQYSAEDGVPNDWHLVHLGSRAVGGAGLVIAEMTDVLPEGRISPGCAGLWNDMQRDAWKRIVDFIHGNSRSKIGVQLAHAGRKGATNVPWTNRGAPLTDGAWPLMAPSAVPWSEASQVPREMTRSDMDMVRDAFVSAARRAHEAGFDLVEIHLAHGYLLSSFLSPASNRRTDDYGGSLANRARFPLEVVDAVRAAWPKEKPISVRISATDWVDGGFSPDDAVEVARMLKAHGVDLVDVSSGGTDPVARPSYGRLYQTPFAERIRAEAGIATMAVGAISTYDDVNTILLSGRADLVAIARAHLADPYFTLHSAREQGIADGMWPDQYRLASTVRHLVK